MKRHVYLSWFNERFKYRHFFNWETIRGKLIPNKVRSRTWQWAIYFLRSLEFRRNYQLPNENNERQMFADGDELRVRKDVFHFPALGKRTAGGLTREREMSDTFAACSPHKLPLAILNSSCRNICACSHYNCKNIFSTAIVHIDVNFYLLIIKYLTS